jgi:release factor glutamine methyltransferase
MSDFPEEYRDGYVLFFGHRCLVDSRALIPRIETEELVKYALRLLEQRPSIGCIADIGTGSGVIPVSLAHTIQRNIEIIATDLSQDALDLAHENFERVSNPHLKHLSLLQGDLAMPLIQHFYNNPPVEILITANLPYVLAREVVGDLLYEPKMAFL